MYSEATEMQQRRNKDFISISNNGTKFTSNSITSLKMNLTHTLSVKTK